MSIPEVEVRPLTIRVDKLKRLAQRVPEVRLAKAIVRWVRSQTPTGPGASLPPEPPHPPSR